MNSRATEAQCLFQQSKKLFDQSKLQTIAARLFRRTADYKGIQNVPRNRKRLSAAIESLLQDIDALHPVTLQPMLNHRHVEPELARLLQLCKEIRAAISAGCSDDDLAHRITVIAHQSKLASAAADTPDRTRRSDWAGPVIAKANEIKRRWPHLKSSAIAKRITKDQTINPTRSDKHKSYETIYKLLNQCEIR